MCCAPNAYHGRVNQRSEVHIGTVHANHHVEMAHQHQLLSAAIEQSRGVKASWVTLNNAVDDRLFGRTLAKEKHTARWMLAGDEPNNLFEHLGRIHFLLMSGERCHANPLLERLLHTNLRRKEPQVAPLRREDGGEIELYGVAQLCKHVGIILESRVQRHKLFVCLRHKSLSFVAVFVDMLHAITPQVEAQAQVPGAQNVVQVGHGRDVFSHDAFVQLV